MSRIGLSGGIGAGKSAVAALLAERGAVVVDSDRIAREVVAVGTPGLAAVAAEFGPAVLTGSGELDRPAMAKIVFVDEERRKVLESILHPLIRARSTELIENAPTGGVVVQDIPLLVEGGPAAVGGFDAVVIVEAPLELRLERLAEYRGMSAEDAMARMANQATDAERRAVADFLVVNDGDMNALRRRVGEIWPALVAARRV